jgi:hypothetical protein
VLRFRSQELGIVRRGGHIGAVGNAGLYCRA